MSLNEIAVDLTCESEEFTPAETASTERDEYPNEDDSPLPGRYHFPSSGPSSHPKAPSVAESSSSQKLFVHGGMLKMAKAMGDPNRPVQVAVRDALHHNLDYDLVLCGHSLGAGVAALLGLMWADYRTGRTVRSSGLPVGRRVSVYCYAPP
jgi:sn1-specific diacylglycerol lipase